MTVTNQRSPALTSEGRPGRELTRRNNNASEAHELKPIPLTREEYEMMKLLRSYKIGFVDLRDLLEYGHQEQSNIRMDGANAFAMANHFEINGGSFPVVNGNQFVTTTRIQNVGGPRGHVESWTERSMIQNAGYGNQLGSAGTSQGFIEGPDNGTYAPGESHAEYALQTAPSAQLSSYNAGPSSSGNLFAAPTYQSQTRGYSSSSDVTRLQPRSTVNIMGSSVMANVSNFVIGEGVDMQPGALSAVNQNQIVYEAGPE
jgi:hypothetical protein